MIGKVMDANNTFLRARRCFIVVDAKEDHFPIIAEHHDGFKLHSPEDIKKDDACGAQITTGQARD
jgi:hypothetical protein